MPEQGVGQHVFPALLVGQDGGLVEEAVAVGVITVGVGVDEGPDRPISDLTDGAQEVPGAGLGGARVDGGHPI